MFVFVYEYEYEYEYVCVCVCGTLNRQYDTERKSVRISETLG